MEFVEILEALKEGKKVAKGDWKDIRFLKMIDGSLKYFVDDFVPYNFDSEDLLKNNWCIEIHDGVLNNESFAKAFKAIQEGRKVYKSDWEDKILVLDKNTHEIILKKYFYHNFYAGYKDFIANDWYVLEDK